MQWNQQCPSVRGIPRLWVLFGFHTVLCPVSFPFHSLSSSPLPFSSLLSLSLLSSSLPFPSLPFLPLPFPFYLFPSPFSFPSFLPPPSPSLLSIVAKSIFSRPLEVFFNHLPWLFVFLSFSLLKTSLRFIFLVNAFELFMFQNIGYTRWEGLWLLAVLTK